VRRLLALSLVAALAAAAGVQVGPAGGARPKITADAFVAIDASTGRVLVQKRARERRPIASLTKIMTGLLAIEAGDLERKIRVPGVATRVEPNKDGLRAGAWYPRRLLLYSAMLESNNDAAVTLAWDLGGGSLERFYRRMNERARALGLRDTHYASPSGLNDERNLSTALDQAILSRAALRNSFFADVVATKRIRFPWSPPTFAKEYVNHNKLLFSDRGVYGVKTGYTTRAGGCLSLAVRRDGRAVIVVLLGSEDVWGDARRLADRAFARI
jgi:D-alanyl-D-alanine carboxypeptidase